ncbi:MAG: cellobiose phosphorylase, partial [Chloroflexi bacterium]
MPVDPTGEVREDIESSSASSAGAPNSPGVDGAGTATAAGATSKTEQIRQLVDQLAGQVREANTDITGRPIQDNLKAYTDWLAEAHRYFNEASRQELNLTYASEWILDNYYIIRQAVRQISKDLPRSFYKELPKLGKGPNQGLPRIDVVISAALESMNNLVDLDELEAILIALQERVPLTMGELWAAPIFLRNRLIEVMSHILVEVIQPKNPPRLPEPAVVPLERPEQDGSAATIVANTVLSLRAISDQDWNEFFESVSQVEQTLRNDPAGVYPRMDFKTRDLYRKEIEIIAAATRHEENRLAELVVELAHEGAEQNGHEGPLAEQRAHVGDYLIGAGRFALEKRIAYRPKGSTALKRWVFRHATPVYLGSIFLLTVVLLIVAFLFVPANPALVGLLSIIPAISVATSLVNWLSTLLLPPSTLPKLRFKDEIPAPYETAVVVPALITSPEEVDSLARQMEMHYLRNPEPGLVFILLTDFADADTETLPEDEGLVQRASAVIAALNQKYAYRTNEQQPVVEPFYFFHRPRLWNPNENRWMGWERKRGKLHQLNQVLQGKPNGSFAHIVGDLEALQAARVRFVITLDADTILPRGGAARLAGTLAHPLNRPRFAEKTGRVVSGYTILQPRVEISATSANRSWFTRIFSGDTGLDLYSLAVSDTYQDLFKEGIFVGKGIYDVEGFERSVAGKIPENSLLSHDLLEGLMGRAGLVTDITLIEDYPASYFIHTLRQRRWIRGDWQLIPWLLRPARIGASFSTIDRWKIIDNLRRSLLAPALLALFVIGILFLPGPAWLWTALVFLTLGISLLTSLARGVMQVVQGESAGTAFHPVAGELYRLLLAVVFLPYEAYLAVDAILTTLYRVVISRRNLLQWTTAAQTAQLFGSQEHRQTAWEKLGAITLISLVLGDLLLLTHGPTSITAYYHLLGAAPVLLLWMISPLVVRQINQAIVPQTSSLS